MSDKITTETVWEGNLGGIPFRVQKTNQVKEEGLLYFIEYRQNPKRWDWGYRGLLHEKDGRYYAFGREFQDLTGLMSWGRVYGPL